MDENIRDGAIPGMTLNVLSPLNNLAVGAAPSQQSMQIMRTAHGNSKQEG